MGIGRTNVGGSGGLNLKIVGGTSQPSGKENLIWVNTSTAINGYAFSATAPTIPAAGMVWFVTGTSASAAINIDKKNKVMIYPNSCYQYISGAWVSKTAMTYLGGTWVDWMLWLYKAGDTDTGLVAKAWKYSSASNSGVVPSISYGADAVTIKIASSSGGFSGVAYFPDTYDLTGYSRLVADVTISGSLNSWADANINGLFIWDSLNVSYFETNAVAKTYPKTTGTFELSIDVSSLSGEHYIGFGLRYESSAVSIIVKEVRLE